MIMQGAESLGYSKKILERAREPHNKGKLKGTIVETGENYVCGDTITVYVKLNGQQIEEFKFDGEGCIICLGCADLLVEKLRDMKISEILKLDDKNINGLFETNIMNSRVKCANLALRTTKHALRSNIKEIQ